MRLKGKERAFRNNSVLRCQLRRKSSHPLDAGCAVALDPCQSGHLRDGERAYPTAPHVLLMQGQPTSKLSLSCIFVIWSILCQKFLPPVDSLCSCSSPLALENYLLLSRFGCRHVFSIGELVRGSFSQQFFGLKWRTFRLPKTVFFFFPWLLKVTLRNFFFFSPLNKYFFLGGLLFWNAYSDCSGGLLNEVSSRCWFIDQSWHV